MNNRKKALITRLYYLRDARQSSVANGKPEGGWLKVPPTPAQWVNRREQAQAFTAEQVAALQLESPYLAGCEAVPVQSGELGQETLPERSTS